MSETKVDADAARVAEAANETKIIVEHKGVQYEAPRSYGDWPAAAGLALAKGDDDLLLLDGLLGPAQMKRLLATGITNSEASDLAVQFVNGLGLSSVGESEASSD